MHAMPFCGTASGRIYHVRPQQLGVRLRSLLEILWRAESLPQRRAEPGFSGSYGLKPEIRSFLR